ncbi:hypothetical protein [Microbacterium sp.]|uniref:hypothetical protein n=1 Tax=Microbacterium sp. TaxID=51671 RepID=UPI0039E25A7A
MTGGGVPFSEATAKDFMQVRAALVKRLGGANEALVWTRIDWRADSARVAHQTEDGTHWWAASYPQIAEETGLTVDQARRAVENLIAGGYLRAEQQHGFSRKRSYAPIYSHLADSPDGENAGSIGRDSQMDLADMPDGSSSIERQTEVQETSDVASNALPPRYSSDVLRLSDLLAEMVRQNGHKVGVVGEKWWSACDRLMRLDGYTAEQVEWMIRWATSDEFWSANIRSMPTLREKFSTLVAQAKRQAKRAAGPAERAHGVVDLGRRMQQQSAGNRPELAS